MARQLKTYQAKEAANSWLPHGTGELLGARRPSEQGSWYIVAHTAAEAIEIAQRAGIPHVSTPRDLRVWGQSTHAQMLTNSGHLSTWGEVIAHTDKGGTAAVAKFTDNGWLIIGHFEYDAKIRETVFTAKES